MHADQFDRGDRGDWPYAPYQPAPEPYRRTAKGRLLWAVRGVIVALTRAAQAPRIARWQERLAAEWTRAVLAVDWARYAREHPYFRRLAGTGGDVRRGPGGLGLVIERIERDEPPEYPLPDGVLRAFDLAPGLVLSLWADAAAATAAGLQVPFDPDAIARALSHRDTLGMIRGISDTLREELRTVLYHAYAEQVGPQGFARRIRELWPEISRRRARLIAHTEYNRAASVATLLSLRRQGITHKAWHTLGDRRVCQACRANAEQGAIPVDDEFSGGVLHPPQHPACRCSLSSVFIAPPGPAEPEPSGTVELPAGLPLPAVRPDHEWDDAVQAYTAQLAFWEVQAEAAANAGVTAQRFAARRLAERLADRIDLEAIRRFAVDAEPFNRSMWYVTSADTVSLEDFLYALLDLWAQTSADSNGLAIFMQHMADREFGLNAAVAHFDKDAEAWGFEALAKHEKTARTILRAMWEETQERFRERGITQVWLVRGVGYPSERRYGPILGSSTVKRAVEAIDLQPLSSYTHDVRTAWQFATRNAGYDGGAQVMAALVPVERVISTAWTGYGTGYEQEFVVLGGQGLEWRAVTWRVSATVAGIPAKWSDPSAITFETARTMLYEKPKSKKKVLLALARTDRANRADRGGGGRYMAKDRKRDVWHMPRSSGPSIPVDADPDNADWLKRMPDVPGEFRERVRQELRQLGWSEEQIAMLPLFRPIPIKPHT
jgi:SPP1 gp7 family putative phage head morphogenesis protein